MSLSTSTKRDWITLPASGRAGRTPVWPLTAATDRESTIWRELWKTPQAVMWERLRQEHLVALYVRRLIEAEVPDSATAVSTWVRQMADSLGLTTPGLRSNCWIIADVDDAPVAKKTARATSRSRLRVVGADVEGT